MSTQTLSPPNADRLTPLDYDSPRDLARDAEVAPRKRLRLLRAWRALALQEERAANEGMTGPRHSDVAAVAEAIESVKATIDASSDRTAPRRAVAKAMRTRPARPRIGARPPIVLASVFTLTMILLLFFRASTLAFALAGLGIVGGWFMWLALVRTR